MHTYGYGLVTWVAPNVHLVTRQDIGRDRKYFALTEKGLIAEQPEARKQTLKRNYI